MVIFRNFITPWFQVESENMDPIEAQIVMKDEEIMNGSSIIFESSLLF